MIEFRFYTLQIGRSLYWESESEDFLQVTPTVFTAQYLYLI